MTSADLLVDAFGRVRGLCERVLEGLTTEQLTTRLDQRANSIAWLVWHLSRIQDDHLADVAGREQIWISGDFFDRFGLPFDRYATGYGHNSDDVAAVRVSSVLLREYHDAVQDGTTNFVKGLSDEDLQRIVDATRQPPVSLGVRLVSVISDNLQHVGQAAFVRGVLERR